VVLNNVNLSISIVFIVFVIINKFIILHGHTVKRMKTYYFLTKLHSTVRPNGMYGHTSVGVTVHPLDTQYINNFFLSACAMKIYRHVSSKTDKLSAYFGTLRICALQFSTNVPHSQVSVDVLLQSHYSL
jgi:hypothetical protein